MARESLPGGLRAAALVVLAEKLRPDAAAVIGYFAAQGVALKVISGDSPSTGGAVAERAEVPGADNPVDARDLPEDPERLGMLLEERIFGRVTPHQKRAMVRALQARRHTVAMTGDGLGRVLRFALPAGAIVAGTAFAAWALVRANGLPLVQQRTGATLVTLALNLSVLVLAAMPLTWRRALMVAAMIAGFVLLFPLSLVRQFYELELPRGYLGLTLLTAAVGVAALTAFWIVRGRSNNGRLRGD